ncbi:MAG TPA: heme ABC exporter ATP-binding protein CcmA [Stellaceae bacterium]|nr:heme ABC exporter ATP-binding protein CcmA [Stellaceae bacterium]
MSVGGFADPGELTAAGLACRRGERLIFSALDCAVAAGGALFLTGPNGSGKSSLLRLLATLLPPQAGGIAWGGRPVADDLPGHRARLHYLGHLDAIKPALAVRETLAFWAETRAAARPAIDAALAAFALEPLADWPCRWLSAGQRRRLALARLIAAPAPLWLLDEPSTALDADAEARLVAAIAAHRAAGGRVVVATHQPLDVPRAQTLSLAAFAPDPGAAVDDALARF